MTIEEKAKAYDEVRKKIAIRFGSNVADEIFSQFEMSEDERIRKDLIIYLRSVLSNKKYGDKFIESWIAWLEKQAEQKPIKEHNICDFCEDRYGCVNHCPMKLIEEEKPADKVESKFYEGDWVVYDHRVYQVVELPKEGYINLGLRRNGKIEFAPSTYCRHWTIQDAREGDVLYLQKDGKEHIIIYKGVIKERFRTFVSAYCAYNGIVDAFCFADVSRYVDIAYGGIMPASKEQRDFLFQKMKEAGYMWDTENKQLLSLKAEPNGEQKPANNVEPKFREGDSIQFKGFGHNRYTIKEVCGLSHYINTMGNSMDMSYTDANFEVIKDPDKVEISTVWSEEDERIRKSLSAYFAKFKPDDMWDADFSFGDIVAWFEKQGERGTKGNDREIPFDAWSEEDDDHLGRILKELENQRQRPFNRPYLDKIESDYNWLKSLKNRYTWKPSDEQMDMLAKVCSTLHLTSGENEIMESIYDALKKLMEE